MTDERLGLAAGAWLRDIDRPPHDPQASVIQVMTLVERTRQVHRWWPLGRHPALPALGLPSRELAPAPIPTTNGRQPAKGFTMYSALKFIAAAVIVALFGGFLLAGVLTTQQGDEMAPAAATASPSPTTNEDIRPGVALTVEEVEPGVFRVTSDGVRDLTEHNYGDIVAGHDGGLWVARPNRFFRVGSDGSEAWPAESPDDSDFSDFEVGPEGTVWTVQGTEGDGYFIQSFDGEGWTAHQEVGGGVTPTLEVTSDGTVWTLWLDREQEVFGYLDEDGWHALGGFFAPFRNLLVAGPDDIWASANYLFEPHYLYRFDDGAWQRLAGVEGTEATWQDEATWRDSDAHGPRLGGWMGGWPGYTAGVGPDGTFWGINLGPDDPRTDDLGLDDLYRLDGSGWSRWPLPDTGFMPLDIPPPEVAPDGSVWFGTRGEGVRASDGSPCGGVAHFDGVTWDRYAPDLCVEAIDITADGAVWLLGTESDDSLGHLYVITPEAVASST